MGLHGLLQEWVYLFLPSTKPFVDVVFVNNISPNAVAVSGHRRVLGLKWARESKDLNMKDKIVTLIT
jgi:hypothetical protein